MDEVIGYSYTGIGIIGNGVVWGSSGDIWVIVVGSLGIILLYG